MRRFTELFCTSSEARSLFYENHEVRALTWNRTNSLTSKSATEGGIVCESCVIFITAIENALLDENVEDMVFNKYIHYSTVTELKS